MAKMSLTFDGFKELTEAIDKAGNDIQQAVTEALDETSKIVQQEVTSASAIYAGSGKKGYATGAMYRAIKDAGDVSWKGKVAEVEVGFELRAGGSKGYHSIFLMYGTPKIPKDSKLYNAVFGSKTKNQIHEKQEEVMAQYLKL